jgi:hypothetical protein
MKNLNKAYKQTSSIFKTRLKSLKNKKAHLSLKKKSEWRRNKSRSSPRKFKKK